MPRWHDFGLLKGGPGGVWGRVQWEGTLVGVLDQNRVTMTRGGAENVNRRKKKIAGNKKKKKKKARKRTNKKQREIMKTKGPP